MIMKNTIRYLMIMIFALSIIPGDIIPTAIADGKGEMHGEGGKKGGRRHRRGQRWMKELNLTDEQSEKIKEIRRSHRERVKSAREEMKATREALQSTMQSGASNSELKSKHEAKINARNKFERSRFDQMLEIRSVLTPEQRKKFKGMRGEMRKGGKGRKGRGGMRRHRGDHEEDEE